MPTRTASKEERLRELNDRIRRGNLLPEWKGSDFNSYGYIQTDELNIILYKATYTSLKGLFKHSSHPVRLFIGTKDPEAPTYRKKIDINGLPERLEWEAENWYRNYLKQKIMEE